MAISYFLSVDEAEQTPCKEVDVEIFFPVGNTYPYYEKAVALCGSCGFTKRCESYARENDLIGIWGGTTSKERGRYHEGR